MSADKLRRVERPINVAVLLSGAGSTLANFIQRINAGTLDAKIQVVVSSSRKAFGLEIARQAGIPAVAVNRKDFADVVAFNRAINEALTPYPIDLIVLAGFMFAFIPDAKYKPNVINIHPALIPMFCGKGFYGHHVHEAVISAGVKVSGCTVHFVDEQYDHGPIIHQRALAVYDDDTPDTLAERVKALEREAYPQVIQWFAEGRVKLVGGRVTVEGRLALLGDERT